MTGLPEKSTLRLQLTPLWPKADTLDLFLVHLRRRDLGEGQYLIRQGDAANELYFIESGEVTTLLEAANGSPMRRLRRHGGGTVLGELGLLLKQPRSAAVMVNRAAAVHCLRDASLQQ